MAMLMEGGIGIGTSVSCAAVWISRNVTLDSGYRWAANSHSSFHVSSSKGWIKKINGHT